MGDQRPLAMTRIVRQGIGLEPASRDYDFSSKAVESNRREGYERTMAACKARNDWRKS
jgi:hypothetical protein